jgi:hypothetical protein
MSFLNVNVNEKNSFLVRLNWIENTGEVSVFDYESVKTWKGKVSIESLSTITVSM